MTYAHHKLLCLGLSTVLGVTSASIPAQALTAAPSIGPTTPFPKEQLMVPPAGARHYTINSMAGKHGDVWSWMMPNGHVAYRMSMNLRGWITEDDEQVTLGPDGRPTAITIRGYTDQGDATENFSVVGQVARLIQQVEKITGTSLLDEPVART